jgi:hypothetical protein
MTSKGWINGEHGIFIAKDEEKMLRNARKKCFYFGI